MLAFHRPGWAPGSFDSGLMALRSGHDPKIVCYQVSGLITLLFRSKWLVFDASLRLEDCLGAGEPPRLGASTHRETEEMFPY